VSKIHSDTAANQDTLHTDSLTDLRCKNDSTPTFHRKTSDQNDVDSPSSARDEGAQNEDSEINSLEVPICSEAGNSDENIQDSFGQLVTQFHGVNMHPADLN
jgi:hypothetical protein